jgi:hypothetical protein
MVQVRSQVKDFCALHNNFMIESRADAMSRFTNPLTACLPSRNPDDAC